MTTATVAPVKGMVWKHARRTDYRGDPTVYTVTSVRHGTVYSRDSLGLTIKTPVASFERFCAAVVSVPEPTAPETGPRLSAAECVLLHGLAHAAGLAAGEQVRPVPMVVNEHLHQFDDSSPVVRADLVSEGVCGFAYVTIRPGNSSFARWARKTLGGYRGFYGGVQYGVRPFGQSLERKMAYAAAYCAVLQASGIKAYAESRMD